MNENLKDIKDIKMFVQMGQFGYGGKSYLEKCESGKFSFNEIKAEYENRIKQYKEDGLTEDLEYGGWFNDNWIEENRDSIEEKCEDYFDPLCELYGFEERFPNTAEEDCANCKKAKEICQFCKVKEGEKAGIKLCKHETWFWQVIGVEPEF